MKMRSSGSVNEQGYTLYLVLLVLSITAALFGVSIRNAGQVQVESIRALHRCQAQFLAQSGIQRAAYFYNGGDGHDFYWETDGFTEELAGYGAIMITSRRFGAFGRISSRGTRLESTAAIAGLAGRDIPKELQPVITLTGHIGGLVLARGTQLAGTVVLDHGDVKLDNNRTPIRGSNNWTQRRESPALPFDRAPLVTFMTACSTLVATAAADSTAIGGPLTLTDRNDSLCRRTPLFIRGDCSIEASGLRGAVIIASGTITSTARCTDVAIYANHIIIDNGVTERCVAYSATTLNINGGRHASQFFSSDSILLATTAQCGNGALLVSRRRVEPGDTTLTGGIVIPEQTVFSGHAICFTDSVPHNKVVREGPAIVLGKQCAITGTLITDGSIAMNAVSVTGHIWTNAIMAVEGGVAYSNWLFGSNVRTPQRELVFPLLGSLPATIRIM
jgi:hypothetical protein